jgi:phosphomannomutase
MTNYSSFFKAYDIRGTVPQLTAELYYLAGYSIVQDVLKLEGLSLDVNIVHDARYSSPEFYKALYYGILDAGGSPKALGYGSTDTLYSACQVTGTPGISLTASHNPKDDNGMKVLKSGSTMLGMEEGLGKVRDYVLANIEKQPFDISNRDFPVENKDLKDQTVAYLLKKINQLGEVDVVDKLLKMNGKKLKIAVDCGNGMGGFVMDKIKDIYENIEFIPLYWELDGNFPNHPSDPQNVENMRDLQQAVRDGADFGFAFDGDADRVFFVDEKAQIINGDFLVAFLSKTLLEAYRKNPNLDFNPAVVYIQPGSKCVLEAIAEADGIAIPCKQGHTSIKGQMQKHKAIYGGEFSGHHYFADFGYLDSGVLAAVLMVKILVTQNKSLSEVFSKLSKSYFISDLMNLTIPAGQDFDQWKEKLKNHFADATISEFDGISVFYPDWKFSMRASNTEPKVRFILESRINNTTSEKIALVKRVLGLF